LNSRRFLEGFQATYKSPILRKIIYHIEPI